MQGIFEKDLSAWLRWKLSVGSVCIMFLFRKNKDTPRVGFVVAGTQKGGTRVLDYYLRQHSEILMPFVGKELHFFDKEKNFNRKGGNYSKYHSSFTNSNIKLMLAGDVTPIYMYWYSVPERIWNYNPEMKFIIILRNPIERAFSHWNMESFKGNEDLPFMQAITTEKTRARVALPFQHRVYSYVDRGFYIEQLRRIWHFFPKDQVLIIKNEDLRNELDCTLEKIGDFLKVSQFVDIEHAEIHSTPYQSKMKKNEFQCLKTIFCHEIEELESILDWDCSNWLEFND